VSADSRNEAVRVTPRPLPPDLELPLTADQLPENPEFSRIIVDAPGGTPADADWVVLADYMRRYPQLGLYVRFKSLRDLEFLAGFEWLTSLDIGVYNAESVDGLRHLPHLQNLDLDMTRKRVSLEVLAELPELASLMLTDHSREVDVVSRMPALRSVVFTSVKRDDMDFLIGATGLQEVQATLGRFSDLSGLAELPDLRRVGIYRTKVTDLAPLSRCTQLASLWLQTLPVSELPDLSVLTQLKFLDIKLKGLEDLAAIARAPELRFLEIHSDTLQPEQFALLRNHPTLQYLNVALKNDKLSYQAEAISGLPNDLNYKFARTLSRQIMND
jgi:hypothetical protein